MTCPDLEIGPSGLDEHLNRLFYFLFCLLIDALLSAQTNKRENHTAAAATLPPFSRAARATPRSSTVI